MLKKSRILALLMAIMLLTMLFAGCNSKKTENTDTDTSVEDKATDEDTDATDDTEATDSEETEQVELTFPEADKTATVDSILGNWVESGNPDNKVTIKASTEAGRYDFSDKDGTYTGDFKEGVLTLTISDTPDDIASVLYDKATDMLYSKYMDSITTYTKEK